MVSASGVKPPAALDFDMKVFNNEKISLAGYDEKQNEGGSWRAACSCLISRRWVSIAVTWG
ncbi:unnamed protein product [Rhodiola kirilowii]